jgi:hypothetical protein
MNPLNALAIEGNNDDEGLGISSDGTNVYVTGYYFGTADIFNVNTGSLVTFGSNSFPDSGGSDNQYGFVAQFDTNLKPVRALVFEGNNNGQGNNDAQGNGVSSDGTNVYVTGFYEGTANIFDVATGQQVFPGVPLGSQGRVPNVWVHNDLVSLLNQSCTPVTDAIILEEGDGNSVSAFAGPMNTMNLSLNGQPRFADQPGKYFNQYQPYQYHSGSPYAGIYVYSFALKPEDHQPSGTCNFSRVDNANFNITLKPGVMTDPMNLSIFAVGYNILRVQGGMGGLAFSN